MPFLVVFEIIGLLARGRVTAMESLSHERLHSNSTLLAIVCIGVT